MKKITDKPRPDEYRIRECNNKFTIEIHDYDIVGTFKKRKVWNWYKTSDKGSRMRYGYIWCYGPIMIESPEFNTMEEAMKQIEIWKNPNITYHYF